MLLYMKTKKIYLACSLDNESIEDMKKAQKILKNKGFEVYTPIEHHVTNAWDYPNNEWGLMVFQSDIEAIKSCDYVVMLSYGRYSTAGANWEAGFAYGIGKKVIVVELTYNPMSLMVANGRYASLSGIDALEKYDWENMPKTRTDTEQK